MDEKNAAQILDDVRQIFATCQIGLRDLLGSDPARRIPGMHNVVVFGRATTIAIQRLRSAVDGFDDWYAPYANEMADDPMMRYFNTLRNRLLKEGGLATSSSLYVEHLDTRDLQPLMSERPPGAKRFFVGDQVGGSGWEVELNDGSTAKFYVQLPDSVQMTIRLRLSDAPASHRGQAIEDTSVEGLSRLYVSYLSALLRSAEEAFGSAAHEEPS